jgi:cytochrome c oxidase cbb3-type subunit 3
MHPRWLLVCLLLCAACDRAPSASSLPEWTTADHDRLEENARAQAGQRPGAQPQLTPQQQLAEAAWQAKCASCHGIIGRGDGPNGPLLKASDLTREEWQAKTSDEQIASVIRSGRGRMPAFADLPQDAVDALVARIRATRGFEER